MAADRSTDTPSAHSGAPSEDEIAQRRAAAELCERNERLDMSKEQTKEVLAAIGAKRIVVVDDEAESIERYIEAYAAAEPGELRCIADEELDFNRDNDAWRQSAGAAWKALPGSERRELLAASRAVLDRTSPLRGPSHLEALELIFPADTVVVIRPQEWEAAEKARVLDESPPPIVLFDQRLGSFGKTGVELLEAYRTARKETRNESDPPAGILSNEVTEAGELTGLTPKERERIPPGSLMLISKAHLSGGDYERAVALFRLTANLQHLHDARDSVLSGLREDVAAAIEDVRQLSPRVLDDLVYRSSRVEGAWEGETLARIAGLYLTQATRRREISMNLIPIVEKARRLSRRVEPIEEIDDSSKAAAQLHQIESFALAEWVNGLRLPLANGDIFKVEHDSDGEIETGCFVMIGQPCDLALRGDGRREAREARLLPIQATRKPRESLLEQALPSSPPPPIPGPAKVLLKQGFNVDLAVLDLCWLNGDGNAQITDVDDPSSERVLTEGMALRRKLLVAQARSTLAKLSELQSHSEPLMRFGVAAQRSGNICLDFDPKHARRWRYPVRRVARLAPRHAEALLVRYSAAQARAAFDHELTRYKGKA
jgi:hypothetical protein